MGLRNFSGFLAKKSLGGVLGAPNFFWDGLALPLKVSIDRTPLWLYTDVLQ